MNRIDDQLDRLVAAIEPVLPGRVSAVPRTTDVGTAIWVDVPTISSNTPRGATTIDADFPVYVTADGATRVEVAALNDAVAKVWDALEGLRGCTPISARPLDVVDAPNRRRRQMVLITVRMSIAARTLCRPADPTASPIPPIPIGS